MTGRNRYIGPEGNTVLLPNSFLVRFEISVLHSNVYYNILIFEVLKSLFFFNNSGYLHIRIEYGYNIQALIF